MARIISRVRAEHKQECWQAEGCKRVAGGRGNAKTSGQPRKKLFTPRRGAGSARVCRPTPLRVLSPIWQRYSLDGRDAALRRPGRVQRPELLQTTTIKGPRCAAERGADSAARCPYHPNCSTIPNFVEWIC